MAELESESKHYDCDAPALKFATPFTLYYDCSALSWLRITILTVVQLSF